MGDFLFFNQSNAPGQLWAGFVSGGSAEGKQSTDNASLPSRSLNLALSPGDCRLENIPQQKEGLCKHRGLMRNALFLSPQCLPRGRG